MWLRVGALIMRNLYLYRRSATRIMGVLFWPVMTLLVWGFMTDYLKQVALPESVLFLLGAIILWDVFFRAQQAITLSISEEIWVRNIINLFVTPIRIHELVLATCLVGLIRAVVTTLLLGLLSYFLYAFNIFSVGPALLPFYFNLMLFGWSVGLLTMALVLRYGNAAQSLIWGVPFIIQPLSAVFYPVETLPRWLQGVSLALPLSHIFEGLRSSLSTGQVEPGAMGAALSLNLVYLVLGGLVFWLMLKKVRQNGLLTRTNME